MDFTSIKKGLEGFAERYDSQTFLGSYRETNRSSLLNEGLGTRANSLWKMAEYVVAKYDNTSNPIDQYIKGWKKLAYSADNQYLFLEESKNFWGLYDAKGKRIGGEDKIILFFSLKKKNRKIRENHLVEKGCLQQIFYGAPGTGKSHQIKEQTEGKQVVRTTFHPDSDYSTFVGAYKPTTIDIEVRDVTGKVIYERGPAVTENKIVYRFVPQAFLKAYTAAWKKQDEPFFLIIEEINRGNCAQIFGDLFQLLDRNDAGESEYPVSPDDDIRKFLQTDKKHGFASLTEEQIAAIPEKVRSGEELILPRNLYIWATMNTSDQSLFPIDSAFKRRWDWQYIPISDGKKGWQIAANGKRYDWWQFLQKMNDKIGSTTNSEDKKLGYFFCKARNGIIDAETFVGKVVFYIWNDVFKDFAEETGDLFKDVEGVLSFNKFYIVGMDGKAKVVEEKIERLMQNLGVDEIGENYNDGEESEMAEDEVLDEIAKSQRKETLVSIQIPNNPIILSSDSTQFDAFVKALRLIGIDKITSVLSQLKYKRLECPVISSQKYDGIIDNDKGYSYFQEGSLFIVKGCKNYTYIRILEDLDNLLSIGLSLETK